jgi:hypothetical protein
MKERANKEEVKKRKEGKKKDREYLKMSVKTLLNTIRKLIMACVPFK